SASRLAWLAAFAVIVAVPVTWVARAHDAPRPVVHLVVPAATVRLVTPDPHELRICADPNNLPFSNARGEGLENAIATLIAGDDYDNPPPALALAARHLTSNVRGYPVYGDYSQPDPQRTVVDDVGAGRIDTAVVWGPIAGYFVRRAAVPLRIVPVTPEQDPDA